MLLPDEMTYGECYGPAMKITDPDEAKEYLDALIERDMRVFGKTREEAHALEMSNLGYYSGYYDHETSVRVNQLFGAVHPVLGPPSDEPISPEEAFATGKKWASSAPD